MKDYLNGEERQQAMFFLIAHGITTGVMVENGKNMSKEEIKCLKFVATYLDKFLEAVRERVGDKELIRVARESKDYTAVLKPRNFDGLYTIDKNALEEIARMAVEANCFGCNKEDWHNCELYKYMHKAGMGKADEIPGKCDFYYEKGDKNE